MTPYFQRDGITLYHGDCLDILPGIPECVDAVCTDPPYLMGSASTRRSALPQSPIADWTNASRWYAEWLGAAFSIASPAAPVWLCGTLRGYPTVEIATQAIGKRIISTVVWDKAWIGVGSMNGLRSRYELVFLVGNDDFSIESRSEPDIWVHKWSSQRPNEHPSEKPASLFLQMISLSCPEGSTILDPFAGSGTTLVAAADAGRRAVGIEIEERYCEIAAERLRQKVLNYK